MATFLESQDATLHDDFDATKYRTWSKRFLNEAVGLIYRNTTLARGDIEISTVINTGLNGNKADLGSEGVVVRDVTRADTGDVIEYLGRAEYERIENRWGDAQGPPLYYTITGTPGANTTRLEFLPLPDQTYTFDVIARYSPAQMSSDSDVVPLPPDYQWYPVRFARSKLFALEDDEQMSAFWMNEWLQGLGAIRMDLQRRRTGGRQIPGMWANASPSLEFHHPEGYW